MYIALAVLKFTKLVDQAVLKLRDSLPPSLVLEVKVCITMLTIFTNFSAAGPHLCLILFCHSNDGSSLAGHT